MQKSLVALALIGALLPTAVRVQVFGSAPTPTKSQSWGRLKAEYR